MITLEQAKDLHNGQEIYSLANYNRKGEPAVYRVNGAVKVWKRDPSRARGCYEFHVGIPVWIDNRLSVTNQLVQVADPDAPR